MAATKIKNPPAPNPPANWEVRRAADIRFMRTQLDAEGHPPSYQQIAMNLGCSITTVYNVITERTHAPKAAGG
jgi:hypothetical protein